MRSGSWERKRKREEEIERRRECYNGRRTKLVKERMGKERAGRRKECDSIGEEENKRAHKEDSKQNLLFLFLCCFSVSEAWRKEGKKEVSLYWYWKIPFFFCHVLVEGISSLALDLLTSLPVEPYNKSTALSVACNVWLSKNMVRNHY